MGSRIRDDAKHIFEGFFEVARPESSGKEPWIIQKFPETLKNEQMLGSVPKFAYPCDIDNTTVQHYSFVLTDLKSQYTFGFCRHDPKTETALVITSYLPWHESFTKLLNCIAELIANCSSEDLWMFLDLVYQSKKPDPGKELVVPYNNKQKNFVCTAPQPKLPSIPENRNLTEYYNAVDTQNMLIIFASMLCERRIIFTSKKLYRLSACVQAANALIYPMCWQNIYIPLFPQHLTEYLLAPMPYLVGVPAVILERVRVVQNIDLGEVVILDVDTNSIETPFQDLESLPSDVVKFLKSQLRNRAALLGDGVSRAFLRALVQLIGSYRDAFKLNHGEKISFSDTAFLESRPSNMQPFLRQMLQLQLFRQFIDERVDKLNAGSGFTDEFEREIVFYSDQSNSKIKTQYKEWTSSVRHQGAAFYKNVKDKANPAVKGAVKTVKERGKEVKTAYKGVKSKMKRDTHQRDNMDGLELPFIFGTKSTRSNLGTRTKAGSSATEYRSKDYSPLSPSSDDLVSPHDTNSLRLDTTGATSFNISLPSFDMNLMGDTDIQDMFRKCSIYDGDVENSSPPVDRTLKPVRSLDSFNRPGASFSNTMGKGPHIEQPSIPTPSRPPLSKTWQRSKITRPTLSLPTSVNTDFIFQSPSTAPVISNIGLEKLPPILPTSIPNTTSSIVHSAVETNSHTALGNIPNNRLVKPPPSNHVSLHSTKHQYISTNPSSSPTSLPITDLTATHKPLTSTNPFKPSPLLSDPFGFNFNSITTPSNPFIPVAHPTSAPPMAIGLVYNANTCLPLPKISEQSTSASSNSLQQAKEKASNGDLIRLNSESEEMDFDPLSSKKTEDIKFSTGLTNPLYPYYNIPNKSKPITNQNVTKNAVNVNSGGGSVSKSSAVYNTRDLDLLKEYGIDFQTSCSLNQTELNCGSNSDRFEGDHRTLAQKTDLGHREWATFD